LVNETIVRGLKPYQIGEKIRALRLRKKLGLVELGKHTGLSAALLSKLERGKLFPTLPTLLRVAMVFGVGLEFFFTDEHKRHFVGIVRKADRQKFPERPGVVENSYLFESLDFVATERKLNAFYAEFQPIGPENLKIHQHNGVEFLFLIHGKLEIKIGTELHALDEGDAIYFDSSVPHTYRRISKKDCSALVVTAGGGPA
jgi:transcriptional regulator with XRE-family HTH domain